MKHDLNKYRQSKVLVTELENLRGILKDTFKLLNRYKKYTPVKPILNEILSAEVILRVHLETQREILKNKGKIKEDDSQ